MANGKAKLLKQSVMEVFASTDLDYRLNLLLGMTPQDVVTGFIVDDGNADRSQRNTLLNPGI